MYKHSEGFTLIELLVVIAIIGILSGVVIANLNVARSKGSDAGIKEQMSSIRPQAELAYDAWGNYGSSTAAVSDCSTAKSLFVADPNLATQIAILASSSPAVNCYASPAGAQMAWAVSAQLISTSSAYWCADSTGKSEQANGPITSSACP